MTNCGKHCQLLCMVKKNTCILTTWTNELKKTMELLKNITSLVNRGSVIKLSSVVLTGLHIFSVYNVVVSRWYKLLCLGVSALHVTKYVTCGKKMANPKRKRKCIKGLRPQAIAYETVRHITINVYTLKNFLSSFFLTLRK